MNIPRLALAVTGFILLSYLISRVLKRNDVADGMWGLGFIGLAFASVPGPIHSLSFSGKLVLALVTLWGVRLSTYLWLRLLKRPEDIRYAQWKAQWGKVEPWRAFFQVFLLQGVILSVIALPPIWVITSSLTWIMVSPTPQVGAWTFGGVVLFLIGFTLEAVADAQMSHFKKSEKSTDALITTGLWAHVRHPNYLGEILIWWGFFALALDTPNGFITVVSPLLITFLLTRVSGVPMLDKILSSKGGADFVRYLRQTPALIPFGLMAVFSFFATVFILLMLDGLWLGVFMKSFYAQQLGHLSTIGGTLGNTVLWAAGAVYLILGGAIQLFAVRPSEDRRDAAFRGAGLGLCVYAVYEFTNLALVSQWPLEMALVDIIWGTFLCATAAVLAPRGRN